MGILGLGKVKMFFTGSNGEVHEMESETTEVTYEPVESEYRDLDFSNKEYTITSEGIMLNNSDFYGMYDQVNKIIKKKKRDEFILNRTKNLRITKKVYKRLYNL